MMYPQSNYSAGSSETAQSSPHSCHADPMIPASVAFVQELAHEIDQQDIEGIIQAQKHMLSRFEKTNEMLTNCNALSASRFEVSGREFKKHTQLLIEMKKDLDSVFRRIRFLKMRLQQQYPAAFSACNSVFNVLDEEEEQDEKSTANDTPFQAAAAEGKLQVPQQNRTEVQPGGQQGQHASSSGSRGSSPSLVTSPSTSDDTG